MIRGRAALSWLALGAAVLVLHAAGAALPAPPPGAPSQWSAWMVGRDPVVVAFGVVRVLGLVAAWYGLVVTAVGVGLRLVSARHLARLFDRLTVVPLRHLVAATVTVGISVGTLGAMPAGAAPPAGAMPAGSAPAPAAEAPPATITMHRVDTADIAGTARPQPSAVGAAPPTAAPSRPTMGATRTTWTVEPGQCFWSIAEAQLGRAWGRQPTAAEIAPYWHRLIEANRGVLVDAGNADLVFPGQVFTLPEP